MCKPTFQKRHYEAIAEAMQQALMRSNQGDVVRQGVYDAIEALEDLFAADNGQFKRDRFARACEIGANVRART